MGKFNAYNSFIIPVRNKEIKKKKAINSFLFEIIKHLFLFYIMKLPSVLKENKDPKNYTNQKNNLRSRDGSPQFECLRLYF